MTCDLGVILSVPCMSYNALSVNSAGYNILFYLPTEGLSGLRELVYNRTLVLSGTLYMSILFQNDIFAGGGVVWEDGVCILEWFKLIMRK